jgi:zinc D-Ala-D-Ala carboxypeptidase
MTARPNRPHHIARATRGVSLVVGVLAIPLACLGPGCAGRNGPGPAAVGGPVTACGGIAAAGFEAAAQRNAQGLYATPIDLFGRPETGWAAYVPAIEHQVGTSCPADSPAFAQALARWSGANGGSGEGVVTPELLARLKGGWQDDRPFVRLRAQGVCPPPPPSTELATAPPELTYGERPVELRRGALDAWARLVRDARTTEPALASDPELLRIFSAFRSPAYDDARCARDGDCQGVVRAACSAHRTGLALDVVLERVAGFAVDSSADSNRLAMSRGLAYRWLVANAGRYGFVNYVFEPWHWEWRGAEP